MPMVGRVWKTDIWKGKWIMETGKEKKSDRFPRRYPAFLAIGREDKGPLKESPKAQKGRSAR